LEKPHEAPVERARTLRAALGAIAFHDVVNLQNARRVAWVATAALTLALPIYLLWFFHRPIWGHNLGYDEQFFTWTGWSVNRGLAPYKDFLEYKPPVLFLTHALALKLFGWQGMKFRVLFFGLQIAAVTSMQASLLSRGANKLMTCAVACAAVFFLSTPQFHDSSWADAESPGYAYFMIGAAALLVRSSRPKVFYALGGVFMSLCFFTKEPFAPCILTTWLAAFAVNHRIRDFKSAFVPYLAYTTVGVAIVIVGLCIYMVPTGAMSAYIDTVLSYKKLFRDPKKSYCVLLGTFEPTGSLLGDVPRQWKIINERFFNLTIFGFLVPAFATSAFCLVRKSFLAFVFGVLTILGALYTVTVSNCYWPHYFVMAQTGIFFFLYLGVDAASEMMKKASWSTRTWAGVIALAAVFTPVYLRWDAEKHQWEAFPEQAKKVAIFEEPIPGIVAFIIENSLPTDHIFTTGAPGIYMVTDRLHATRISTFMDEVLPALPGDTDEEKLASRREELEKWMPKLVILDPEHGPRKARHDKALFQPFLAKYNYRKVGPYYYVRP